MKSSRSCDAMSSWQNASTLGVCLRSSPKISSRCAHPQQLEAGLVADLHASAGEQRRAAGQVGELGALREVEVAAGGTELVVEVMKGGVLLLADVAVPLLHRLAEVGVVDVGLLEPLGREDVRRVEHGLPAQ